jgi:flagellar M-ring protein FliF
VNPENLAKHLKTLAEALSAKQILGLVFVFIAVVGVVISSAYWISKPDYALLVADMDGETAASVVGQLKAAKVQYELGDGGRSVSVPVEKLDELRLQFASGGLPSAGRLGFEIFDRPAFGTTEFLEHVNYRRALEGELARTIGTLSEVASARVHIAMAKDSLFVAAEQPAKASVILKLRGNRVLPPATVKGIAGLVASAVESLRPESVTIVDTYGRFLSRPVDEGGSAAGTAQLERQQQIERDLSSRVIALLEPAVGVGRVRVNVAAVLNADVNEQTEERFDPANVIRSKQTSNETAGAGSVVGGVAGARANQPPALAPPPPAATASAVAPGATPPTPVDPAQPAGATGTPAPVAPPAPVMAPAVVPPSRTSETTNYEVSKVTRHTAEGLGKISRLSVAVIVDDKVTAKAADGSAPARSAPWEPAEIQRLQGLVAAAVGIDPKRGDHVTVENMSFDTPVEEPEPPAPPVSVRMMDGIKEYGPSTVRMLAIVAVALFALFGILRPLARRATAAATTPALPPPAAAAARLPTISEMEGQIDESGAPGQRRLPVLTKRVAKLANEEPEQLARIVRGWMAEDQR